MSSESPAVILYSSDGIELSVQNGVAIPANTRSLMTAGTDGSNARYFSVDTSGRQVIIGAGTGGSPVGGVVSIQGVASGTVVPVSGSVTVSGSATVSGTVTSNQGTAAAISAAWPIKITDGTNAISILNTNPAGTEYAVVTRNIPSGTQTVSGTVTANAGTGNFIVTQTTAANLNAAVVGTGVAGSPTGGVLSIQGVGGGTAIPVSGSLTTAKSATSTITSVAGSATTVTLLALNAARLGATIYNDSSALLYVKLGATASLTSFTIRLLPLSYYEVPFSYTGVIDGLWASATGSARVDELT